MRGIGEAQFSATVGILGSVLGRPMIGNSSYQASQTSGCPSQDQELGGGPLPCLAFDIRSLWGLKKKNFSPDTICCLIFEEEKMNNVIFSKTRMWSAIQNSNPTFEWELPIHLNPQLNTCSSNTASFQVDFGLDLFFFKWTLVSICPFLTT